MKLLNKNVKLYDAFKFLLRVSIAISTSFILTSYNFYSLDAFFYDLKIKLKPTSETSHLIVTVNVNEVTLDTLKRKPNVKDHINFLQKLAQKKPKKIIYTIDPTKLDGSNIDKQALAKLGEKLNLIYASPKVPKKGLEDELKLSYPYGNWNSMPAPRTRESIIFAKDYVTRRMIVTAYGRPTLHTVVAAEFRKDQKPVKGLYKYFNTYQTLIDFKPTGTYPEFTFHDLTNNRGLELPSDKIVIVGLNEKSDTAHYIRTPYSRTIFAMTTTEMQANMLDTLILNSGITEAPRWVNFIITSILSLMILFVILRVKPAKGLLSILAIAMGLAIFSYLAFTLFHFSINMVQPLITIFVCYYFFIPYRLIVESREKWEFQKKNKLLVQVEEMKNNFMKMMSHDLKTPLARIQGMADITLTDGGGLSTAQRSAVQTIKNSSQELSELITSILDLGRVENQGVKLHLNSKDINDVIKKSIKACEYSAQKKNITLIAELEPLFSIKIDEHLIKQAITNLIENAIKYSPEGSKVLITSEEVDNEVLVQVSDQGIGISENEVEHVFDKFYRSKEVTNKDVKGSGLGLYLTKYFINLHQGDVSVESEMKKGSTFSMNLPLDLN